MDGDRPYLPEDFICKPEWERVFKMAKEILGAFNYQQESD